MVMFKMFRNTHTQNSLYKVTATGRIWSFFHINIHCSPLTLQHHVWINLPMKTIYQTQYFLRSAKKKMWLQKLK